MALQEFETGEVSINFINTSLRFHNLSSNPEKLSDNEWAYLWAYLVCKLEKDKENSK